MDHSEVHAYLNSFINFESQLQNLRPEDFHLNRIEKFLDISGIQLQGLKVVHIAGTKGKGSTCAFLASILQKAGYTVGLYTSPHLFKVNERIRILNKDNEKSKERFSGAISDKELAVVLSALRPFAAAIQNDGNILTYFELLTVAALYHFSKKKVDVVILETGLGGRLDATNAVDSSIAVVTPISFDHTRILGSTLKQIASEKAGIIKNSLQKVVIAPQEKEAMDVLLARCKEFGVHPFLVDPRKGENLKLGLKGQHQRVNAATVMEIVLVLKAMGFKITEEQEAEGFKNVRWPGRFELLKKNPDIIVDGAHNDASARALSQTLEEVYSKRRIILILGISSDKDITAICDSLKDEAAHIILTRSRHPRSHIFTSSEARKYFDAKPFEITDNLQQAMERALQIADSNDVIVVTGSLFIVAEAMSYVSI